MISTFGYLKKRLGPFSTILKFLMLARNGSYKITIYLFVASILIFFGLAILGFPRDLLKFLIYLVIIQFLFWLAVDRFWYSFRALAFPYMGSSGHGTAPTAGSIIFAGILVKWSHRIYKILATHNERNYFQLFKCNYIFSAVNIVYGAFSSSTK